MSKTNQAIVSDKIPVEKDNSMKSMYKHWFLDYASYVILERAVPAIQDGLKPVQRRLLHTMKSLDDGRYNKVANIVGSTMQYHPHGDASIADAIVQLGQKNLLIDTQGNWGNILTGDKAAASRYIEARLTKFALEIAFNPKITQWQSSYDGRKKEPLALPVKFPLLLALGGEGIAVGLSTKILPHNFNELLTASIAYLKGKPFQLYPDFTTGGSVDVRQYNDGKKGGRIRVRATISPGEKNTLIIRELAYGTTTSSLIDSIVKANEKGKVRIKKIEDNTADIVEIVLHLPNNTSINNTIASLYAFTACENVLSPICCLIVDNKPRFSDVSEILKISTDNTVKLLEQELRVQWNELNSQKQFALLEKVFIDNKIYQHIEKEKSWQGIINTIKRHLKPFETLLMHPPTEEDITKLTEIKIKRISRYDINRTNEKIKTLSEQISLLNTKLNNITEHAIAYFKQLKQTYGKGKGRKTVISAFTKVDVAQITKKQLKLYVDKKEGFIGTNLKNQASVADCSDMDEVIVFTKSGKMIVVKIGAKIFIEKNIIHASIFSRNDKRTVYHMIYLNRDTGVSYMKRFNVLGITRDSPYNIAQPNGKVEVLYFSENSNGETETVTISLKNQGSIKKLKWDVDFRQLQIKGRETRGNIVSKNLVEKVTFKHKGQTTLQPQPFWHDTVAQQINSSKKGTYLGFYKCDEKLVIIDLNGRFELIKPKDKLTISNECSFIEKWLATKTMVAIYRNKKTKQSFIKRFSISEKPKNGSLLSNQEELIKICSGNDITLSLTFEKPRNKERPKNMVVNVDKLITVKKLTARGKLLTKDKIKTISIL